MKPIALATLVLASMSTLALSQESYLADVRSEPISTSPEALRLADEAPALSIGPMAGYLNASGADNGTWFGGVQARLRFAKIFAAEASISFHQNQYEDGDVVVTTYPVQLTAFLYPFPDGQFRPYILGGVGWYYTRIDYTDDLEPISDETESEFGVHLGAGLEIMLGGRTSINADLRYIFLNATNDQVIDQDFNYWQITLGLNIFF